MTTSQMASILDSLTKFQANLRWAKEHPTEVSRHSGRYIVVSEGRIVFHSASRERAESKGRRILGSYVTYVTPEQWAWIL